MQNHLKRFYDAQKRDSKGVRNELKKNKVVYVNLIVT